MQYGFDTDDAPEGIGALLVYAAWRSRDKARLKITPKIWGQVEDAARASAQGAATLGEFLDLLKPHVECRALDPRWCAIGAAGEVPLIAVHDAEGRLSYAIQPARASDQREFLTGLLRAADHKAVLRKLRRETALIVLLVRDRLERERPLEEQLDALDVDTVEEAA